MFLVEKYEGEIPLGNLGTNRNFKITQRNMLRQHTLDSCGS
jgi:hypothetical protein